MFPSMQMNLINLTFRKQVHFWKWVITRKIFKHLNDKKPNQNKKKPPKPVKPLFPISYLSLKNYFSFSNIFIIAIVASYSIHLQR